jgi:hypothetical protein
MYRKAVRWYGSAICPVTERWRWVVGSTRALKRAESYLELELSTYPSESTHSGKAEVTQ